MNILFNSIKARLLKFIWDECGSILGIFAIIGPTAVLITLGATDFTRYQITQNQVVSAMYGIGNLVNNYSCGSSTPSACSTYLTNLVSTNAGTLKLPTSLTGFTIKVQPVVYCSNGTILVPTDAIPNPKCTSGTSSPGNQTLMSGNIKTYILGYFFSGKDTITLQKRITTITAGVTGEEGVRSCQGIAANDSIISKTFDRSSGEFLEKREITLSTYDGTNNSYTNQRGDTVNEQYQLVLSDFQKDTMKSHKYSELSSNWNTDQFQWTGTGSNKYHRHNYTMGLKRNIPQDSNYNPTTKVTDKVTKKSRNMGEWNDGLLDGLRAQIGTVCMLTVFRGTDSSAVDDYYTIAFSPSHVCATSEWDSALNKHVAYDRSHGAVDSACGDLGSNKSYIKVKVKGYLFVKSDQNARTADSDDAALHVGATYTVTDNPSSSNPKAAGSHKGNEHVDLH